MVYRLYWILSTSCNDNSKRFFCEFKTNKNARDRTVPDARAFSFMAAAIISFDAKAPKRLRRSYPYYAVA